MPVAKLAVPINMYTNELEDSMIRVSRKANITGLSMQITIQLIAAKLNKRLSFPVECKESKAKTKYRDPIRMTDHSRFIHFISVCCTVVR